MSPEAQLSYQSQPLDATPDLASPYYGASFPTAVSRFWQKSTTFSGRASRSEFWWAQLMFALVIPVFFAVGFATGDLLPKDPGYQGGTSLIFIIALILLAVFSLAAVLPSFALICRRLHDANYSGWLYFLAAIPMVGGLIVFVMMLLPANPLGERFDEDGAGSGLNAYVPQG